MEVAQFNLLNDGEVIMDYEVAEKAFNAWMDDYTNNPDEFASATADAIRHLKERHAGEEPSYGALTAETFKRYVEKVK